MDKNQPPQDRFVAARTYYYDALKKTYLELVEIAEDKDYSANFHQRLLFSNNAKLPRWSIYFDNLVAALNHCRKLDSSTEIEQVILLIPSIRKIATKYLNQAAEAHLFAHGDFYVHATYAEAIERGILTLEEIIQNEQSVLDLDETVVIETLALYDATQLLLQEFSDDTTEGPSCDLDFVTGQESFDGMKLSRPQIALVTFYIGQLLGVKHDKNVSNCAKALHVFLGLSYVNITHQDLYKMLLDPMPKKKPSTIKNLRIVRTFFQILQVEAALKLIDEHIEQLSQK